MPRFQCDDPVSHDRRAFIIGTAVAGITAVALGDTPVRAATPDADKKKFMAEATRLATESVEKGWGGPFGAVIVKDGEIIGRGQNRVLLTGCPVYHAEITAIIDASGRLNPKGLLGSDYGPGTMLEMIPREQGSPDPVPERARMLKGCEIYINGAPCPMCMSAIYWSRIDHLYFAGSLEDTREIGFDDAFQYEDFAKPWDKRRIGVTPNFERETGLAAYKAWMNKKDRHPYWRAAPNQGCASGARKGARRLLRSHGCFHWKARRQVGPGRFPRTTVMGSPAHTWSREGPASRKGAGPSACPPRRAAAVPSPPMRSEVRRSRVRTGAPEHPSPRSWAGRPRCLDKTEASLKSAADIMETRRPLGAVRRLLRGRGGSA